MTHRKITSAVKDKLTEDDVVLWQRSQCLWTVEYGMGRGVRSCGRAVARPTATDATHQAFFCPEHATEAEEDF